MERVKTLIEKLQRQSEHGASAASMLSTVQMLQAELWLQTGAKTADTPGKVAIIMPITHITGTQDQNDTPVAEGEKIVEVLQVDEEEIENELAEIKKHANTMHAFSQASALTENFDPIEDVPTLAHQNQSSISKKIFQSKIEYPEATELEESLNDRLKQATVELSETLTSTPIKDLRKAIMVNDRFVFINELFRGDEAMYERSVKTIQGFAIFAEAEFWIRRELKLKLGWNASDPVVRQFDELVRRRFL